MRPIRIATRQSKLALWQANYIKSALIKKYPDLTVELVGITTMGDEEQSQPLVAIGGKSNFVTALQVALATEKADIAVHSIKDMSVFPARGLVLAAICERANPFDAFISHHATDLFSLPENAVIGTASPRRSCLIRSLRPDLQVKLLRGNVDTRLEKLDDGNYDAIILAAAGLERLGLEGRIRSYFSEEIFTPAIGQGAIAIEAREDDKFSRELVAFLHHLPTADCVNAERVVNQVLGGDCHTPVGAYAKIIDDQMRISAMLGNEETGDIVRAQVIGRVEDGVSMGEMVAHQLLEKSKAW